MRPGHGLWLGLALGGLLSRSPAVAAQQATAAIHGQVVDRENRAPIPGAAVTLLSTKAETTSDSAGRFAYASLKGGAHFVQVRAVGYTPERFHVQLDAGEVAERVFEVKRAAFELPGVVVEERRAAERPRFADFEHRRERGVGHFITRREIDALNPARFSDVFRTIRGVRLECAGWQCVVRMARAPRGCLPQYFLDGQESSRWSVEGMSPYDVEGVEVYLGPSETPPEFLSTTSGCGVIAVWSKAYP